MPETLRDVRSDNEAWMPNGGKRADVPYCQVRFTMTSMEGATPK